MWFPGELDPKLQQVFRSIASIIEPLEGVRNVDFKARRLMNLSDGTALTDAVTLQQLQAVSARIDEIDNDIEEPDRTTPIRIAAYAHRGAPTLFKGTLFAASDRNYVTWASTGAAWVYVAGLQTGTLSPDTKPTLTTNDAGYLFGSTDFNRVYRWSGTAWADAPGSERRGSIVYFDVTLHADFAPGAGWQLCNGTAGVTRSTPAGGTTTVTVPDLTTDTRFIRSVAVTTGGTGGSATTHTHSVDPPNTTSGNNSASQEVQAGAGETVADHTHTHDTNIASFTSGAPSGSGGDDALPPYMNMRPYMRL